MDLSPRELPSPHHMKPHLLRRALCTAHPSPSEGADWGPYRSPSLRAFICFPTRQANSGPVLAPGRKVSARPPSHTSMLSGCPYRSRILSAMLPLAVAAPRSARVSSLDKPQNCRHSLYPGGEGQDCLSPGSGCPPPARQLGLWPQGPSHSGPWRPHAQQTWRWTVLAWAVGALAACPQTSGESCPAARCWPGRFPQEGSVLAQHRGWDRLWDTHSGQRVSLLSVTDAWQTPVSSPVSLPGHSALWCLYHRVYARREGPHSPQQPGDWTSDSLEAVG